MSMTRDEVQAGLAFYARSDLPRHRDLVRVVLDVDERARGMQAPAPAPVTLTPEIEACIAKAVDERVAAAIAAAKAAKPGPKAREDLQGDSVRQS